MDCLRCKIKMNSLGKEDIQLGRTGFFTGSLGNLLSGSITVEIFVCPECRRLEFFSAEE